MCNLIPSEDLKPLTRMFSVRVLIDIAWAALKLGGCFEATSARSRDCNPRVVPGA